MNHAVLFEQVVIKFIVGNKPWIVAGFIINLNRDSLGTVFNHKISKTVVVVNIIEVILAIKITGFFRAKGIGE